MIDMVYIPKESIEGHEAIIEELESYFYDAFRTEEEILDEFSCYCVDEYFAEFGQDEDYALPTKFMVGGGILFSSFCAGQYFEENMYIYNREALNLVKLIPEAEYTENYD